MSTKRMFLTALAITTLVICLLVAIQITGSRTIQHTKMDVNHEVISLQMSLQSYCESALKEQELACANWIRGLRDTQFQAARHCKNSFDWLTTSIDFSKCLQGEDISLPVLSTKHPPSAS